MENPDYEYRGLMAQTWDLFRGDTSQWEDRFFFLEVIQRYGQPALDVGCGTGRLLLDFLATGIDIDGVDNSPEMLALCRQRAAQQGLQPVVYEQFMETLELPRCYRTILVPSSSFQLVLEPEKAAHAMRRFYELLLPDGVLIMPFMIIWSEGEPLDSGWSMTREAYRQDGTLARRHSRAWYDPERQLEHTEDRYEILRDGVLVASESHQRSPSTRWYTQQQVVGLYANAGFPKVELLSGFTFNPAADQDAIFCALGFRQ